MAAHIAAADVDSDARQNSPVVPHRSQHLPTILAVVAAISYLVGLIAMLPASVFVEENERLQVGGTIWSGESVLDGAIRVEWSFSPLTTLAQFAWSADWHITGAANDLTGRVTQAGEQLQLANISGQTDGVLIDTMFPNLPLSCDFTADLAVESLFLGGEGQKGVGNLRHRSGFMRRQGACGLARGITGAGRFAGADARWYERCLDCGRAERTVGGNAALAGRATEHMADPTGDGSASAVARRTLRYRGGISVRPQAADQDMAKSFRPIMGIRIAMTISNTMPPIANSTIGSTSDTST